MPVWYNPFASAINVWNYVTRTLTAAPRVIHTGSDTATAAFLTRTYGWSGWANLWRASGEGVVEQRVGAAWVTIATLTAANPFTGPELILNGNTRIRRTVGDFEVCFTALREVGV